MTRARHFLRLALLAIGVDAANPAGAQSGPELLKDVCVATLPRFEGAAERVAALNSRAIAYDGKLFEQVDGDSRLSWTVRDEPDATVDRFLVDIVWGSFNALPAASCVIADKKGFTLAELGERFAIKRLVLRSEKVLYESVADAVAELPDGRRVWLTLWGLRPQDALGPDVRIGVATLMSSEYLNALMEKDR